MGDSYEDSDSEASSEPSSSPLKEDGHFFDFVPFYKQPQFCDRTIRLEILGESASGLDNVSNIESAPERQETGEAPNATDSEKEAARVATSADTTPRKADNETITGKKRVREGGHEPVSPEKPQPASARALRTSERLAKRKDGAKPDGNESSDAPTRGAGKGEERTGPDATQNTIGSAETAGEIEGGEGGSGNEKSLSPSAEAAVEEIPISSIVVAAKSQVLRTMLTCEMKEGQRDAPIVLKVTREEKRAFKEMINFIYNGTLSARLLNDETPTSELIETLLVADKFDAPSFMGAILAVLGARVEGDSDEDLEAIALDIPDILHQRKPVKELVESAQEAFVESFKNVSEWYLSRFLDLEIRAVQFLLQAEGLEGATEEGVLGFAFIWVEQNFDEEEQRREAFLQLARHIRFGCIGGEHLENMLTVPVTQLPETQDLIQKGLVFQAYSDPKKLAALSVFSSVREGFKEATLDIIADLAVDDKGLRAKTVFRSAEWLGRTWCLRVEKATSWKPETVGVYLTRYAVSKKAEDADEEYDLEVQFLAREWPTGYWALLKKRTLTFSKAVQEGKGSKDMFSISWQEVGTSKYVGPTKEITLRVVARKLVKDSDTD